MKEDGMKRPFLERIQKNSENPAEQAAKERAESIVERAQLNEALAVVDELLAEVETMHISNRFRPHRKISDNSLYDVPTPLRAGMGSAKEDEFKRVQLESDLRAVGNAITNATTRLHSIVMDIEATKVDETEPLQEWPKAGRSETKK